MINAITFSNKKKWKKLDFEVGIHRWIQIKFYIFILRIYINPVSINMTSSIINTWISQIDRLAKLIPMKSKRASYSLIEFGLHQSSQNVSSWPHNKCQVQRHCYFFYVIFRNRQHWHSSIQWNLRCLHHCYYSPLALPRLSKFLHLFISSSNLRTRQVQITRTDSIWICNISKSYFYFTLGSKIFGPRIYHKNQSTNKANSRPKPESQIQIKKLK